MDGGALLIDKHPGVSSFGVIEALQNALMERARREIADGLRAGPPPRRRDVVTMGHGGTLDPFATGLLAVCVGRGVKLARYFLGSRKTYEGVMRFGSSTPTGDPTVPVEARSDVLPESREALVQAAQAMVGVPYWQIPPMHSAKKIDGKRLYELAQQGIEVERKPKELRLYSFDILSYEAPCARFRVECSSGTYIRTLAQDLAKSLGTIAMLDSLHRTASGIHRLGSTLRTASMNVAEIAEAVLAGKDFSELRAWVPFDRLLDGYDRADATPEQALALFQGRQGVLPAILSDVRPGLAGADASTSELMGLAPGETAAPIAIYSGDNLVAMARMDHGVWGLERVFIPDTASVS